MQQLRIRPVWCVRIASLVSALLVPYSVPAVHGGQAAPSAGAQRPNILFIFSDDHATHAISAYGSKINQTPHMDRLAREGMLFRNAFVTNSICGPSRATILTGKYSHRHGVFGNDQPFDGAQVTFPRLLQQGGYQTALIGKWHLFSDPTGFDHWNILIGMGQQGFYYNPPMRENGREVRHTGYVTDIVTDLALGWLKDQRDPVKPFLLMVQHKAPHRDWKPGPDHLTLYDDVDIPEPPTLFDDYAGRSSAARLQEMTIAHHLNERDLKLITPAHLTPEQRTLWDAAYEPKNRAMREANLTGRDRVRWNYQRYIKDYLRTIASVDDNIGRLLAYLDDSGLADNTIVIYASDQGFFLGDHGWYDKRFMYEESLRAPFIVRWPGVIEPGSENHHLVLNLDYAQTFLEMAGVAADESMQGRSLVPLMTPDTPRRDASRAETPRGESRTASRPPEDWRTSIYYHYYEWPYVHMVHKHYGVRTERYKLMHFYMLDEWELFDLEQDPRELRSVYDDPAYAEVRSQLKEELARLQEYYGDDRPTLPVQLVMQPALHERALAVQLEEVFRFAAPRSAAPPAPQVAAAPLTVGSWCVPQSPDGVLVAQGGEHFGYSLFVLNQRPYFTVRNRGRFIEAIGRDPLPLNEPVHLAGMITADAQLKLFVNGQPAAAIPGHLLEETPREELSIGADTGTAVGGYQAPMPFEGELRDMRLYLGELGDAALKEWATR